MDVLLIKGQESITSKEVEDATGGEVTSIPGAYSEISKADSYGQFDAVVWSGHGGFDGPNFTKSPCTIELSCLGPDGSAVVNVRVRNQPSSEVFATFQWNASETNAEGKPNWMCEFEAQFGQALQVGCPISGLDENKIFSFFQLDLEQADLPDSASYDSKVGKEGASIEQALAPALGRATRDDGFIYLGSCNNGNEGGGGEYEDYVFASSLAGATGRTVFAAPMKTSSGATAVNLSRITNRDEEDMCDLKLQDRVRCF